MCVSISRRLGTLTIFYTKMEICWISEGPNASNVLNESV